MRAASLARAASMILPTMTLESAGFSSRNSSLFHPAYRYGIDPVGIPAMSFLGLKLAVSRDGSLQLPDA
ncbi:MAG TPA: hypothetical protein VF859_08060, partial [Burkholderiales bacterium]